jgi:hypothetical protein
MWLFNVFDAELYARMTSEKGTCGKRLPTVLEWYTV